MTDRNERDADLIERVEQTVGMGHAAWDTIDPLEIAAAFREALAAPAEGGWVSMEALRRWHASLEGYDACDVADTVATRGEIKALIDSAGGAKGRVPPGYTTDKDGSIVPGSVYDDDERNTPQPAEGDGAVLVGYTTPAIIERALAQGRSPGLWLKSEGDEVPVYAYTRPAATAQVPEGWRVLNFTGSFKTRGERWEVYDPNGNGGAICDGDITYPVLRDFLDALAAAPAAPKGEVVDEAMARRYLAAQKDYIGKVDAAFGRQVAGALHGDDVIGACMAGLTAALATPRAEQGGQEVGK